MKRILSLVIAAGLGTCSGPSARLPVAPKGTPKGSSDYQDVVYFAEGTAGPASAAHDGRRPAPVRQCGTS